MRVKSGSSTDGTRFQYGWNPVPVRVEPNLSADVMEPFAEFIFSLAESLLLAMLLNQSLHVRVA